MRTHQKILVLLFLLATFCIGFAQNKTVRTDGHRSYFYAPDVENWVYVLKNKTIDPSKVFLMENGVLHITGQSNGYLRTKNISSNYELSLEYRWTKVLANSGVLVHIQPKDTVWPACFQVQQRTSAAGDIICMNGLWAKECKDSVKQTVSKMNPSNEKPLGEWNSMQIICEGKTLKVFVNGTLQNYITGLNVDKGYFGFQNEGQPIEFRSLFVKKIMH